MSPQDCGRPLADRMIVGVSCRAATLSTSAAALQPVNDARVTVQHVRQAFEIARVFAVVACVGAGAVRLRDRRASTNRPSSSIRQRLRCTTASSSRPVRADGYAKRVEELQGLMTKAETGAGGSVVAEIAYRPDYVSAQATAASRPTRRGSATAAKARASRPIRHSRARRRARNPPPAAARAASIDASSRPPVVEPVALRQQPLRRRESSSSDCAQARSGRAGDRSRRIARWFAGLARRAPAAAPHIGGTLRSGWPGWRDRQSASTAASSIAIAAPWAANGSMAWPASPMSATGPLAGGTPSTVNSAHLRQLSAAPTIMRAAPTSCAC